MAGPRESGQNSRRPAREAARATSHGASRVEVGRSEDLEQESNMISLTLKGPACLTLPIAFV